MTTWAAANARRLARHGLATPFASGTDPADIAAATVGVHAQVLSAAEISAALRVEGATRADVRRALWHDRTLVKTFGPRGTVHLLPAADLAAWMAALAAIPWRSPFPDGVRLTTEQTEVVVEAIGEALSGSEPTVDELTEALGDLAGAWAVEPVMPAFQTLWPRWRQITDRAAYAGALCYGPDRARKVTYTHPSRWTGEPVPVDAGTAVDWLVGEYLRVTARLPRRRSRSGSVRRRPGRPSGWRPTPIWSAPSSTASPRGTCRTRRTSLVRPAGPRTVSACCPTSTRSSSAADHCTCCSRAALTSGHSRPRARPGTTPWCLWTGRWPVSGTNAGRVAVSR